MAITFDPEISYRCFKFFEGDNLAVDMNIVLRRAIACAVQTGKNTFITLSAVLDEVALFNHAFDVFVIIIIL